MEQETIATKSQEYVESDQFQSSGTGDANVPLVVDLDGTLVRTNLLIESLAILLRDRPQYLFALPIWLSKSKAAFKQEIARRISFDAARVPYRAEFTEYLKTQRANGRAVVLATASDQRLALRVAEHLKLFDSVLASDGTTNLSGGRKRTRLVSEFGERGFDYAANARCDIPVWSSARNAIVINPSKRLVRAIRGVTKVQSVFEDRLTNLTEYLRALRPQHWLKNLLVFIPFAAAHRFYERALWGRALLAFMAFCLCASSGYLINDLIDVSTDRHHPSKRLRPFAAGQLPLSYALVMAPLLVVMGCVLGALVSPLLAGILLLYCALSPAYSLYIKKVVLLDVVVLAILYTLRLMAGAAAVAIWPSPWLLAFSIFLFLSLALVKRYDELVVMRGVDGDHARARCYEISDAEMLAAMGIASGYMAVLVLALYITSGVPHGLYGKPQFLWFLCLLLLYWVGHIWLAAHRGKIQDDPVLFSLRNRTSRILIMLMLGTVLLAM